MLWSNSSVRLSPPCELRSTLLLIDLGPPSSARHAVRIPDSVGSDVIASSALASPAFHRISISEVAHTTMPGGAWQARFLGNLTSQPVTDLVSVNHC